MDLAAWRTGARAVRVSIAVGALAASAPALAGPVDFSGKWSVSGHIVNSRGYVLVSPVCDFKQTGGQVAGACKGPNGGGDATGLANGAEISFQWRTVPSNAIGLRGVASFNGVLGADGVIRGSWSFSTWPGATGQFTAQRP